MTLSEAVYALLSSVSAVTERIGDRLYPVVALGTPAVPYLVYSTDKDEDFRSHDDEGRDSLSGSALIVTVYAGTPEEAAAIGGIVHDVLLTWRAAPAQAVFHASGPTEAYDFEQYVFQQESTYRILHS